MKIMNNFTLYSLVFLFHSAFLFSGGIILNGFRMQNPVVDFHGDHIEANNVECIASKEMKIVGWNYFKGSGLLKAPKITIKAKEFHFTGTISCDVSCEIITEKSFNHAMFKKEGKGKFTFVIEKFFEPQLVTVKAVRFRLDNEFEVVAERLMRTDDSAAFTQLLAEHSKVAENKKMLSKLLKLACLHESVAIVERIASIPGAVVEEDQYQMSALLFAVNLENVAIVELLITHGADVNQVYRPDMLTPLMLACDKGNLDIVKLLLKAHADISISCGTVVRPIRALDIARRHGHLSIVKYLQNPELVVQEEVRKQEEQKRQKEWEQLKKERGLLRAYYDVYFSKK